MGLEWVQCASYWQRLAAISKIVYLECKAKTILGLERKAKTILGEMTQSCQDFLSQRVNQHTLIRWHPLNRSNEANRKSWGSRRLKLQFKNVICIIEKH